MSEHLNEPLDYLYEELSPEGIAEARKHLAECPKCREEMRQIRETVKSYRRVSPPPPPPGLAARVAARALAEVRDEAVAARAPADEAMVEAKPDAPPATADQETEFARLKEEILGEVRGGWRHFFFHPGWALAASVLFVCTVIIHYSPRGYRLPDAPAERSTTAVETSREAIPAAAEYRPLPAPKPVRELPASTYRPTPPVLQEAEADKERMEYFSDETTANVVVQPALPATTGVTSAAVQDIPAAPLEEFSTDDGGEKDEAVVLFDFDATEPPQLFARPTPIDVESTVLNLTTLAGMQIGSGEYADARKTIELLRRLNPARANELAAILTQAEIAALESAEAKVDAAGNRRGVSDKYAPAETGAPSAAESAGAVRVDRPADAEPPAPQEAIPVPDGPILPAPDAPASPFPETAPPGPAPSAPDATRPETGYSIGPVYSADETPPAVPFYETTENPGIDPETVEAPTVPKRSPDAFPPTLWENTNRSRRVGRPRDESGLPAWRRTFSTDPYLRDE